MVPEGRLSVLNAEVTASSAQHVTGDRPKQVAVDEDRGDVGSRR
jgi:hypothetical protein